MPSTTSPLGGTDIKTLETKLTVIEGAASVIAGAPSMMSTMGGPTHHAPPRLIGHEMSMAVELTSTVVATLLIDLVLAPLTSRSKGAHPK